VTSSITVPQALLWEILSAYDEIAIKNLKRRGMYIKENFHLKDDLRMEFII